jgi:predicted PurR-regulated permease PerM
MTRGNKIQRRSSGDGIQEEDIQKFIQETQKDFTRNLTILAIMFFIFGTITYFVILNMPVFSDEEKQILFRIPYNGKQLNEVAIVIKGYSETNYYEVMAAFCCLYVFLQTFAIPGAIFLSILSGALFGGIEGFTLVCI